MEIISAHTPTPFAFISVLKTQLGSSRSGAERLETASSRGSPRPVQRLPGPGSGRGSRRGAAGQGPGGGRERGQALPSQYTQSSRGLPPLGPGSPAAGALPGVAVPDKPPRLPRGEGTRPLTGQDAQVTEEQQAEAAARHLLGNGRSPPAAAANNRRGVR